TPQFNKVYRADLIRKAAKWQTWIEARFNTFDTTKPAGTTTPQPQQATVGVTPEERAGKNITLVTNLAQSDTLATEPPKNDGTTVTPTTPNQLIGFSASVKQIPVESVVKADYQQPTQQLPGRYNKAAADALAAVYGNIKLR
ncbi:TPA: conjugal transfer protein, partial [Escherichia coli]|nr:conjugal transfer protein [Escherichia coli]